MKRTYNRVTDEQRLKLIELTQESEVTIKAAAEMLNISYENAKAINRVFKHEDRTEKRKKRNRRTR